MRQLLHLAATHGRILLVGGILAGVLLPDVGLVMRPWLGMLVALLLFLAAFRIGPKAAVGGLRDFGSSAVFVVVTQLALPLAAAGLFALAGMIDSVVAMAIVLMLAAPSISGSANFSILVGHDPAPALRLAVFGTAAFPLTALLVFWLLPGVEGDTVLPAALRLLLTIALATGLAFALRGVMPPLSDENRIALDGFSALTLAVTAIGLVSALGPALWNSPASALGWIAVVFLANYGLQLTTVLWLRQSPAVVPSAIVAGNRNVALFLVALPPELSAQLLVFIGAYQLPMYLTPLLLGPVFGRFSGQQAPN